MAPLEPNTKPLNKSWYRIFFIISGNGPCGLPKEMGDTFHKWFIYLVSVKFGTTIHDLPENYGFHVSDKLMQIFRKRILCSSVVRAQYFNVRLLVPYTYTERSHQHALTFLTFSFKMADDTSRNLANVKIQTKYANIRKLGKKSSFHLCSKLLVSRHQFCPKPLTVSALYKHVSRDIGRAAITPPTENRELSRCQLFLSSLVAPHFVMTTTVGNTSEDKLGIMTTFVFKCDCDLHVGLLLLSALCVQLFAAYYIVLYWNPRVIMMPTLRDHKVGIMATFGVQCNGICTFVHGHTISVHVWI